MLSVNPIGSVRIMKTADFNTAGFNNTKKQKQNTQFSAINSTMLPGYGFYSDIAFTNRRNSMSLEEKFARIKPEQFPSKRVYDNAKAAIKDPENKKTLYDIHLETYAPLLECKTLDEAKAMFPEFETVRDAKDLFLRYGTHKEKEKAFRSAPYIAQLVFERSVPEVKIEDLSLQYLKKIYGKGYATSANDKFYDFDHPTTVKTLKALNIKPLDAHYVRLINGDNTDIRNKRKAAVKKSWNSGEDGGKARREEAKRRGHIWWDTKTDEQKAEVIKRLYDANIYVERQEAAV